jgi:hypothetical protein
MRFSLLLPLVAVMAVVALAPAANARPYSSDPTPPAVQNLQSPDAQDANAAQKAQTLQDLARLHAGGPLTGRTSKYDNALKQEQSYMSHVKAAALHRTVPAHDDTPWDTIAAGIALIAVVGAAVGIAVRSRRRVHVAV